jgi:hypothetical protein
MVLLIICLAYFVPTVVASVRGHHNQGAIFALNLLLGWTLLGWVAAFVWACTATEGRKKVAPSVWTAEGLAERYHLRKDQERQRTENESEKAKWARMSSEPLPKVVQPQKQRDLVGPIVIGGLVVIASVLFMGWYSHSQITTTVETTSSIAKPQSTVMEGLTPEQIELLKPKRDAMALPVAEPPHKKKKWAE